MAKIIHSTYIHNHPYFTARQDGYQLSSGKIVDPYYVVELPDSVCVMAITAGHEVLMIRQYRYPVDEILLELPGGFMDNGEEPEIAASRELLEETGYAFEKFQYLGLTYGNPGVLCNATHLYLATGGTVSALQSLDENEEINIELHTLQEVERMLHADEIKQSMHALCLHKGISFLRAQHTN